jgi:hypothetical protein
MHLLYRLGSSYAEIRGELGETGHGPVVSGREDTEEELIDGFDSLNDFQHILVAFELRRGKDVQVPGNVTRRNNRVVRQVHWPDCQGFSLIFCMKTNDLTIIQQDIQIDCVVHFGWNVPCSQCSVVVSTMSAAPGLSQDI